VIRNLIFDWSGTLVDDLPAVWQATNHVFRHAGVAELSLDQFRAEFSLPFMQFYSRYVPQLSITELEALFHRRFREVQDSVVELPFARDFLQFCRSRGLRSFVLSTVHPDHFAVQAGRTGFAEFFEQPYLGVHDKRAKIAEILAAHELARDETVFIGDMQHDIDTAKHGGIHSCAVLTGYNRLAQLRASQPDLIVEHLGELQMILEHNGLELRASPAKGASRAAADSHPIATVGALIFNERGEALMIRTQKWSGLWGIPGGKIKLGEPSLDALRREIKEETSLELSAIEFVLAQDCINSTEFYRPAHFILLNYVARCSGANAVTLNEEAEEFRWLPLADTLSLPLNRPTRVLVEAVLNRSA